VDTPHDWSIEDLPPAQDPNTTRIGPFGPRESQGKASTGWVVGGTGWYRRWFRVDPKADRAEVIFDGVYMDADVWLNGQHLGSHPYGYTSFWFDLTPYLDRYGQNLLAVRVRNEGRNSRWYSGSGIYRHVWLRTTGLVHVPTWGLFITTPEVSPQQAKVVASVELANAGPYNADTKVIVHILGANGRKLTEGQTDLAIGPHSQTTVQIPMTVTRPRPWGPDSPTLYTAVAEIWVNDRITDRYQTTFGIRTIEVDAKRGLLINGQPIELKGGCMHHDNGVLGAAAIDRAEWRRVELVKQAGFNAIRTSHNPPSSAFLDACDRLGILVMDEAFDQWQRRKNPQDYHRFFDQWWEADITSMVKRDRNHPSVIIWSIGNEVVERDQPQAVELARMLRAAVRSLDPTRPVTEAINGSSRPWADMDPHFAQLDICGYNYEWRRYEQDHQRCPDRVIVGTESFPMEAFENWQQVIRHPYVIGDFVWTGFDYLGESGIGRSWLQGRDAGGFTAGWPWHIAGCGDIDILGRRKPQSYYREALWRPGVLYAAVRHPLEPNQVERISRWGWPAMSSHWTWPGWEGKDLKLEVYSSCDSVVVLLNGRHIAQAQTGWQNRCKAQFDIPYEPGQLKVIGHIGNKTREFTLQTAGSPSRLRLVTDRTSMSPSRNDLAFVDIEVVDSKGVVVPYAQMPISIQIKGPGQLAGIGNANPTDVASFQRPTRNAWQGRLQAIVRPTGDRGLIEVVASADGVREGRVRISIR
jgi:beta-galactosidase